MRITNTFIFFLFVSCLLLVSCKSEFEKLRISGDANKQLAAANKYYENEEYLKAQALYELVISTFRGKKEASRMFYRYANTHYELGDFILAAYYFKTYTERYPTSPYKEDAMYYAAMSNYYLSPSFRLDQKYTRQAIDAFQLYANTYPHSDRVSKINEYIDELRDKLQKKAIAASELYYKMKSYQSAVRTYNQVLQDFPETQKAEEIRYRIIDAQSQLAVHSIYEKKLDRAKQAVEYIRIFRKKYPNSDYLSKISGVETTINQLIKKLQDDRHQITSTGS